VVFVPPTWITPPIGVILPATGGPAWASGFTQNSHVNPPVGMKSPCWLVNVWR